ncbi:GyrI-like domain-containing protein [Spirillospora sp. CA-253888]
MREEPVIENRDVLHYAGIPIKVTLPEWHRANALVPEIYQWLERRGIAPLGGPVYRYRTIGGAEREFDLEVGVPVAGPVDGDGRVLASALPAGAYAVAVHHGHPDRQEGTHQALQEWAATQGVELDCTGSGADTVWTARYETYLTDPAEHPDPEQWSTELAYLTKRRP